MRRIAILGLGQVGLPVARAFARRFPDVVGFDTNPARTDELAGETFDVTADPDRLADRDFYIVTVPTPIDAQRRPDLGPLSSAARIVGAHLRAGDIVVFESTVYPGVTEEVCARLLCQESGLVAGRDFFLGYSPERINPGDSEHTFERTPKLIAAQDRATLDVMAACYGEVLEAPVHPVDSIRVAEAAKVIENVQRDLNIALMNELSLVFDRLGIDTKAVIDAASTKWNFHAFRPGLVGGHCIGVDPYYLTALAEKLGIHPQVILAGRRINDGMGSVVASQLVKLLSAEGLEIRGARTAVLGLTYKAGTSDVRNSGVPGVVAELEEYGVRCLVRDPLASPEAAGAEHGLELHALEDLTGLDAVLLAVAHPGLPDEARGLLEASGARVLVDLTWTLDPDRLPGDVRFWRL